MNNIISKGAMGIKPYRTFFVWDRKKMKKLKYAAYKYFIEMFLP